MHQFLYTKKNSRVFSPLQRASHPRLSTILVCHLVSRMGNMAVFLFHPKAMVLCGWASIHWVEEETFSLGKTGAPWRQVGER